MINNEQRAWLRSRRKKRLHILAVMLCFCVLFTTYPDIPVMLSVFAVEESEQSEAQYISGFAVLPEEVGEQTFPVGTGLEELSFPDTLEAVVTERQSPENAQTEKQEETVTINCITWQSDSKYDGSTEGTYVFTAVLPEDYILAKGVSLPEITVTVQAGSVDNIIQILLDRIAELPDTEEYLTAEPDMEYDAETYAKWEEKLYEYTEEALAIWEEYEALTEEQHAMISEEESAKLTAWVELAEQLLDSVAILTDNSAHHAGWTALSDSDTELSGGNYYLADNIKMGTITITGEVTLCLNGKILEHLGDKGSVIVVGNGGTFTLCDCQDHWDYTSAFDDGTGKYTYGITGTGGCIIGGKGDEERVQGGGVLVNSGNFIMESGRITGCDVYKYAANNVGGGVYVKEGGTFLMSGGFIDGNKATMGGGVAVSSPGTFTMSGNAVIMNNEGNGGVDVSANLEGGAIINMNSGKILGNGRDNGKVGGIYFEGRNAAVFNMKGGVIEGNIAGSTAVKSSAGIYCANTNGNVELNLSGGCIQNNTGAGGAGGIYMENGKINVSGSICISDNYSNGTVNNVSLNRGCTITVADGLSGNIGVTYAPEYGTASYPVRVAQGKSQHPISDGDCSHFSSDNENYGVLKKKTSTGNELYLAKPFGISLNGAEFSPAFDSFTARYTSTVANDVGQVGITATIGDSADITDMSIQINNGEKIPITSGVEKTADLIVGKNQIVIYAPAGAALDKYTFEITREEAEGNNVNITSYKDGTVWTENPPVYKLSSDNGTTFVTDLDVVPDGTYKIYCGDTDTKETVTVNGAEANARVDYYTVTFYDKDTMLTAPASQTVLKGTAASAPTETLTKPGYTFDKWVKADGDGTEYTFTEEVTKKTSLFASWKPVSYKIEYHLDGGTSAGNPASYTIESSAITLNNPTKEGYIFTGWSGTDLAENSTSVTIVPGSTGDRTYTAHWKLADYTIALHTNGGSGGTDLTSYTYGTGATLPVNLTKTGYTFDGWYDNENFNGTAVTNISGTDTGNKEYWAKWTDNIAPVIGTLIYNYKPKNFWHWLIGKDSLIITVPVTEEGSGADEITYTVTQDGGTESTETAAIQNGEAKITVSADFKGTISIVCTDKANNTSAGVTVGAGLSATGIIIEDNAPQIAFQAENAELVQTGEYRTAPDIVVNITDDKDNAISSGIASVSYKIGNGSEKTVAHDYMVSMVVNDSFTIPASEIPAGETVIYVTATDHSGNSNTQNYTVKVHIHSGTLVPAVEPTCTTAGNKEYYTCTCGKWFSDRGCINEITDKSSVVINALGHGFSGEYLFDTAGHWKKCSRCAETTSREKHRFEADGTHCTVCDYEKEGEEHTHKGELHAGAEPTCTTKGNTAYYTCNCGKWFSDSGCTAEITDKSVIEIAPLEHDFVTKHDRNEHWQQCSRCSLEQLRGVHIYENDSDRDCNVCGYERTIQVHTHSGTLVTAKPATCTDDGHEAYYTCSCGKWFADSVCMNEITDHESVIVGKLGHDLSGQYLFDANGHWKVCRRCNIPQKSENHVFDDDNDTTCNKCGYQRTIEAHTHSVERTVTATEPTCTAAGNRAYYICSCGKWFSDSACTTETTESDTKIAALGHNFATKHDQNEHWQQCSRCALEQSREVHIYDNDSDRDCNMCGYERTIQWHTHNGTLVMAKPATCTESGHEAYYTCSCGKWFADSACMNEITDHESVVVGKLGHDFSGQYLFNANGHWKVCRRCNIPQKAENHVFDDDNDTTCNKCGYQRAIGVHTHDVKRTVAATEPTCTAAGNRAYYICSCGKWFSDSACTKEVTAQDVTIPAKGHTAVTDPAKAATCTKTGLSEGSHCSVCGHVIKAQTVTAALGHDYGEYHRDAGGHWKVCRRCGAASMKHSHNYDNDRDTCCNDCGWERVIQEEEQSVPQQPTDPQQPTPQPPDSPQPTPQPSSPANPPEQSQPTKKPNDKPGTVPGIPDNSHPEDKQEPESARITKPTEKPTEKPSEEPVATGNVEGMADTSTVLKLGDGAVIVTVVCEEQEYTAGVADTLAVVNAVLTTEQMELVNNGETIEIRIDVKDISNQVPEQDRKVIESGIEEYQKETPGMTLGMYVDISMFIKIGEGEWNAITEAEEPIEMVIGIPEKLQEKGREYVIIRAHDGVHTFMNDMDDKPDTITISTDMFSSYAIAYVQAEGTGHKCRLCHICPTVLGICCFVWLAIIIFIMIIVIILLRKKKA